MRMGSDVHEDFVAARSDPGPRRSIHPLHAILLAFPFPLFLGALLSDLAYSSSFQIQWANFSAWLIAGGLLAGALTLLWSLINLFRNKMAPRKRPIVYFSVLLAMWVVGLVNAFVHAKDAWATMPEGLYLSAASAFLALVAAWIGYSGFRTGKVG
ncbi:DUF2231 domain-containing protein [Teichococcus oryzae]|uniref:DUF2231 domain-containing protein n=1 Tax=Teichococcus oryzae TaxID=1608942 RepID=UPI001F5002EA|nr:DUF2231 domain-containing protein [Pseudoroseomonas oryzae]